MITPDPMRKYQGVWADSCKEVIHVGGVAGQRYTDEVDQVIAGKRQGQCEGTHQDDHLEYIHLQPVENLHQDGESDQAAADNHTRIVVNLGFQFRIHEGTVL